MTASTVASAPATRRRKLPNIEKASFMLVFLGVPLALYVIFVISPFVQAFYYSMTDWSGFSRHMNFIGLENYARLLRDSVFLKAVTNNLFLALVLPPLTIVLSLGLATLVTVGGSSRGEIRGLGYAGAAGIGPGGILVDARGQPITDTKGNPIIPSGSMTVSGNGGGSISTGGGPTVSISGGDEQINISNRTSTMIDIAKVQGQVHAQSVEKVGELAEKNPHEAVSIIRNWLHEEAA